MATARQSSLSVIAVLLVYSHEGVAAVQQQTLPLSHPRPRSLRQ
jgi:hypothetical protein